MIGTIPDQDRRTTRRRRLWRALLTLTAGASVLVLAACGSATRNVDQGPGTSAVAGDWDTVLAQAKGQRVNWYMYGGDDTLNTFVSGYLTDQLAKYEVTLNQVRITDTSEAMNKVLGEKQAGRTSGGSVDAIWVNGENFATGVQAGLWFCGWDRLLPNSKYVDFSDPAVQQDFGVPVQGCEAVWQQADSALVYNSASLTTADVASISSLFGWAAAHPGRFTYPALPDFTGSMAVRTVLYDTIGGPAALPATFTESAYLPAAARLWTRLNQLEPSLWRAGQTYPQTQAAVEKLYGDGEIDAYFTYGPGAVADKVAKGLFPASTRQAVPSSGNIANRSFIAIPANAAHREAAMVLANVLQDPATQLALFVANGTYPGIDLTRTSPSIQKQFADVPVSASVLPLADLTRNAKPELASTYISRIEKDWTANVLQK